MYKAGSLRAGLPSLILIDMATIFSKIITGEIPSYKVAENEDFYAFLDINPLAKGHTLVVPKREVDYIFDLADDELASMHVFHIHLIPIQKESDMIFSNPKLKLANEEFVEIARTINEAWEGLK